MKLKFVTDEVIEETTRAKGNYYNWTPLIEELYKHPNKWVEVPVKFNSQQNTRFLMAKYKDIEARAAGGNRLPADHPDKIKWTYFVKYVPQVTEGSQEADDELL